MFSHWCLGYFFVKTYTGNRNLKSEILSTTTLEGCDTILQTLHSYCTEFLDVYSKILRVLGGVNSEKKPCEQGDPTLQMQGLGVAVSMRIVWTVFL